ncbi:MAG: hypothetical protein IR159_05735 [Brevundimonas sp.]|nr:hypothetical protein [Brevundimonas sp.]
MNTTSPGGMARIALLAALAAGTLDIGAAILTNLQVPARVVLQSVAGGWLGAAAYQGGWPTAWLGLASHYAIMLGVAVVYVVAAARAPILRRRWLVAGVGYGLAVWLAMTFVVVPLSASTLSGPDSLQAAIKPVVIHILCVGLPIAWIVSRMAGRPVA